MTIPNCFRQSAQRSGNPRCYQLTYENSRCQKSILILKKGDSLVMKLNQARFGRGYNTAKLA